MTLPGTGAFSQEPTEASVRASPRDPSSPSGHSSADGPRAPRHASSAGTVRTASLLAGLFRLRPENRTWGGGQDLRPGAFPGCRLGPTRRPENLASGAFPTPRHLTPGRLALHVVQQEGSRDGLFRFTPELLYDHDPAAQTARV